MFYLFFKQLNTSIELINIKTLAVKNVNGIDEYYQTYDKEYLIKSI